MKGGEERVRTPASMEISLNQDKNKVLEVWRFINRPTPSGVAQPRKLN